jgi:riboflavin synthase
VFTGIIKEIGRVTQTMRKGGGKRLTIEAPVLALRLLVDDSISVSGVCQTVVERAGSTFTVEAVEETLRKTTLGALVNGSTVNLEIPMTLQDLLGGHLVQGHVDCVGTVVHVEKEKSDWLVTVEFPQEFGKYVIPVGSITLDGISLTVARVSGNRFTVAVIPHTLEKTTLAGVRPGSSVNLEFDLIGKYVEQLLSAGHKPQPGELTAEKLKGWGYGG